jgi:hypothetical protein
MTELSTQLICFFFLYIHYAYFIRIIAMHIYPETIDTIINLFTLPGDFKD